MFELRNWSAIKIIQINVTTSCIPAGIEWLLRYLHMEHNLTLLILNLDNFQNEFDLQHLGIDTNSFGSVSNRLREVHPELNLDFQQRVYNDNEGILKIQQVEELVTRNIPVLYSAPVRIQMNVGIFHIMPVIGFDNSNLFFYNYATENTNHALIQSLKSELIQNHRNSYPGGNDIFWIEP